MKKKYTTNKNSIVYACRYLVAFCVKYKRKLLTEGVAERLSELINESAEDTDIVELNVYPDHVEMLIDVDPQFGVNKAVKGIKAHTARVLRKEYPDLMKKVPTLWTDSYFISAVGNPSRADIEEYIDMQKNSQRQKDKMG